MNKSQMKALKPGDVVVVNYNDDITPGIEVVKNPATVEDESVGFESGRFFNFDQAERITKVGHFNRILELE